MLHIDSQAQKVSMSQSTKTAILVIGGAEDKVHGREILHTFFERAGGKEASVGIIPSASREPGIIGSRYQRIFEEMGAKEVRILDIRDRAHGEDQYYIEYVQNCTGIFMTGGDQLRLCGLLADTPLMEVLLKRVHMGEISLAGTSAGAAVMGYHMIGGGGSGESPNRALVDMTVGLGVIPEVIVDQHFHNRNRIARLLSALAMNPDRIGVGIDEDTCAIFEQDGVLRVMGRGTVMIIDPTELSHTNQAMVGATDPLSLHNLRVHLLCHGDRYHLQQRQPMSPDLQERLNAISESD
ncbi:MAG: cyanophycinase [Oscillatoria sp. PMC 1068.18]|nr:cyanophycinase [Oscillatoria sp. PMC 1076.18]MEC4990120.1 cyanophycinase [Oscillatoria sp. PMC 1068.18]